MPDAVKRLDARGLFCLFVLLISLSLGRDAAAETLWGLTTQNTLVRFTSTAPGAVELTLPVTGLPEGERLIAINISAQDGTFLGISSAGRLYTIDRQNGTVTALAAQTGRVIVPSGTAFDLDRYSPFNSGSYVLELASNVGQRIKMPVGGDAAQVVQFPFPAGTRIVAMAGVGAGGSGLAVDASTDRLYIVSRDQPGPPTLTNIGPLGIDTSDEAGMARAIYEPNTTHAALTVGGVPGLYRISDTGQVLAVGGIGSAPITSLAADREALTIIASRPPGPINGAIPLVEGTAMTALLRRTGDATAPVDYVVTTGSSADLAVSHSSVHFASGERERTITVSLIDDDIREGREEVGVFLTEERSTQPFVTSVGVDTVDNDNQRPVLTVTTPSESSVFVLADTMTISGLVTDDRPGTVVYLFTDFEMSYLGLATGSPWTFENVPTTAFYSTFLNVIAVDAEGAQTRTRLHVQRGTNQIFVFAEGATGSFFHTDLLFANPASLDVPVTIDFLRPDGSTVSHALTVPANRSATLDVASVPGLEGTATSAVVHAVGSIAVERTMRWDAGGYGASTERASTALSATWHFAEGSQGFFSTFLLLVNPQASNNIATVRFLRESGGSVTRSYTLAPRSRLTIDAGGIPELVNQSFGMEVTFTQPAAAERAMYFGETPRWTGGHASAGAPALSTDWLLAEGATGPFFDTFVLVANPSSEAADVTFTFFPSTGAAITRTRQIPANGRLTVNIELEDPALANAAVGTRVISTVPIVVERSQYWPYTADRWYEAHNSVGQTVATTTWTLAEGRSGGPEGYQTYILLTNPTNSEGLAFVSFLRDDGNDTVGRNVVVPARSRVTISVDPSQFPELTNARFGTYIVATMPIVVERSMYWNANGQFWAAGTNAPATRQPF